LVYLVHTLLPTKKPTNMKKSIVIGGSSGIGKGIVEVLLRQGYLVGLSGIERDDLSELQKNHNGQLIIQYIDCSKENCSAEIQQLVQKLGGLDLMIFSAGIGHLNKDLGYPVENRANKVNVLGFTEVVDWSYRFFANQGYGHLVAITSVAGHFGFRESPAYPAAKGYQINYMEGLRQKAHRFKGPLYVTDIRAGFVDTEFSRELKRFWVATPEKAARQIYIAIKRKRSVKYVTRRWKLIALLVKIIPDWLRGRL
jgi:short-subunit dehydrogenase